MEFCAGCGKPIEWGDSSYYRRDPAGGDFGRTYHSIIARYLCREDGRHPDGMYGAGPARHWEDYQRDADDIIAELAIAGYLIAKVTHTKSKPLPFDEEEAPWPLHHENRCKSLFTHNPKDCDCDQKQIAVGQQAGDSK